LTIVGFGLAALAQLDPDLDPDEKGRVGGPGYNALLAAAALVVLVLWSALTRGGWSFWVAGLSLRRVDGRPAGRGQSALRTLLAGLPLCAASALSSFFGVSPKTHAIYHYVVEFLPLGVALVMVGLILWRPACTWYDRLVGTRVVPR
jgi:hypothetical protein